MAKVHKGQRVKVISSFISKYPIHMSPRYGGKDLKGLQGEACDISCDGASALVVIDNDLMYDIPIESLEPIGNPPVEDNLAFVSTFALLLALGRHKKETSK